MNSNYPRLILAGTSSRVGKTTIALGMMLALKKRGMKVQPFKTGPDYIDSSYHTQAAGRVSRNLDTWLLSKDRVLELFVRQAKMADISIIEGVMGLYDGLRDGEEGSTAHLAKVLSSPVILIMDSSSMSRSAGACVLGYKEFDRKVDIRGVILNRIGSPAHYKYAKDSIEKNTNIPVLGFLPKDKALNLDERHLGLVPAREKKLSRGIAKRLLNMVEANIDIDRVIKISRQSRPLAGIRSGIFNAKPARSKARIAVAKDEAFNFYYQDNLDILEQLGGRIVEFSPLRDSNLPKDIAGVYIGGGFPELFASGLSKNIKLKYDILKKAKQGLPVYAECGGLMYLVERLIDFKGRSFPMAGLFKGAARMGRGLQGLGYIKLRCIKNNILSERGGSIKAHIFHWSYLDRLGPHASFAYKIEKNGKVFYDGLIKDNILAGYSHIHFASDITIAKNFINRCREYMEKTGDAL